MNRQSEIIKLTEVNYSVGGKEILKGVNLKVNEGELISVVGPNGSGKSTLAKLLGGILLPSSGKAEICGIAANESEESLAKIRQKVGLIFQNPDNQIIASTVEEEIAFGLENLCVKKEDMKKIIGDCLTAVGLEGFEKRLTHTLSGGQKQRLNIASIIAMQPEIIVFDEPTSMLDPKGKSEIMNLIFNLNQNCGVTIILVTHSMKEALFSKNVAFMQEGEIKKFGAPEEILGDESCMSYISPMQSAQILFFLKKLGYDVCLRSFGSGECAREIAKILNRSLKND